MATLTSWVASVSKDEPVSASTPRIRGVLARRGTPATTAAFRLETPVYAIADGTVRPDSREALSSNTKLIYPIIEHRGGAGEKFDAIFGHTLRIDSIATGTEVLKGQHPGTIGRAPLGCANNAFFGITSSDRLENWGWGTPPFHGSPPTHSMRGRPPPIQRKSPTLLPTSEPPGATERAGTTPLCGTNPHRGRDERTTEPRARKRSRTCRGPGSLLPRSRKRPHDSFEPIRGNLRLRGGSLSRRPRWPVRHNARSLCCRRGL